MYLLASFILQNFKKILGLIQRIQSYEDWRFLGPNWPICHEQIFFDTTHYHYFHLPIGPFIVQKFKKILTADLQLEDGQLLDLKWPISPNDNFFQKTC